MSNITPLDYTYRDYQAVAYAKTLASIKSDKHSETLLANCTGSGKTPIALAVASSLLQKDKMSVHYATPYLTGKNDLSKYEHKTIGTNYANGLRTTPIMVGNIEKELDGDECLHAFIAKNTECIHAGTHSVYISMYKKLILMGDVDCSNIVFMVDESHHKSLSTDITFLGKLIEYIINHGGKILYISATPYREYSNRTELIYNPSTIGNIFIRTVGDMMRDGFAPSLSVEYAKMDITDKLYDNGGIYGDLSKSRLSKEALIKYVKKIIKSWVNDGCPKAVFLIPPGNSKHDAEIVKVLFEEYLFNELIASKRGRSTPSVLVTLNDDAPKVEVNGEMIDALYADSLANGRLYDVIIGCKKFDEATDVPSASHMYMIGIPSNTRLFHQRAGRLLRNRHDIVGYADFFGSQWLDMSKIVFMAPYGCTIENFDKQVSQQLLITMFSSEAYVDFCEATSHVGSARIAIENVISEYDEDDAELAEGFSSKMKTLELTYNATRGNEEYDLYVKSISEHPTIGKTYDSIMNDPKLTNDQKIGKVYALIQHFKCGSEKWDVFATASLDEYVSIRKKNKSKILNPNKIIHEGFKRIVDEFREIELSDNVSENIKSMYATLTGKTFEWYSKKIIDAINTSIPPERVLLCEVAAFKENNGRIPNPDSTNDYERELGRAYVKWQTSHPIIKREE
jgi:hypothetical protein